MSIDVIYSDKAFKSLKKLDRETSQRIVKKIRVYSESENPLKFAKKLNPPYNSLYRFKVGHYRVVFEIDLEGNMLLLVILKIGHRRDIY